MLTYAGACRYQSSLAQAVSAAIQTDDERRRYSVYVLYQYRATNTDANTDAVILTDDERH
jgi:hypothetical protein